jgi:hypothetical protein
MCILQKGETQYECRLLGGAHETILVLKGKFLLSWRARMLLYESWTANPAATRQHIRLPSTAIIIASVLQYFQSSSTPVVTCPLVYYARLLRSNKGKLRGNCCQFLCTLGLGLINLKPNKYNSAPVIFRRLSSPAGIQNGSPFLLPI